MLKYNHKDLNSKDLMSERENKLLSKDFASIKMRRIKGNNPTSGRRAAHPLKLIEQK